MLGIFDGFGSGQPIKPLDADGAPVNATGRMHEFLAASASSSAEPPERDAVEKVTPYKVLARAFQDDMEYPTLFMSADPPPKDGPQALLVLTGLVQARHAYTLVDEVKAELVGSACEMLGADYTPPAKGGVGAVLADVASVMGMVAIVHVSRMEVALPASVQSFVRWEFREGLQSDDEDDEPFELLDSCVECGWINTMDLFEVCPKCDGSLMKEDWDDA